MLLINVIHKLKNNDICKNELLNYLDCSNTIILYHVITYIVNHAITDKIIIDKLFQLSQLLNEKYTMLGYYKIGHVAMAALLKLGFDEKIVFQNNLDDLEKETTIKFCKSAW